MTPDDAIDSGTFWLTGLQFEDGTRGDLFVNAGVIAAIGMASGDAPRIDRAGWLCLPALIEAHVHLDKTFLGAPWQPHLPGASVAERIRLEKLALAKLQLGVVDRGSALVEQELRYGTGFLRSHVDIDPAVGLRNLEGVLEIKRRYADKLDMQIVAFPQSGILSSPGTEALLDQALGQGANVIGGLDPASIDGDPARHLDIIFGLADKHGADIDIHLHEGGALGVYELVQICARTERAGLAGRVTVSHAFCLGQLGTDDLHAIGGRLAAAGVAILTAAPPVSMPPLMALHAEGVTLVAGNDNIRDAWSPFGNGDVLQRASIAARQQQMNTDAELALALSLVTSSSARALRLKDYGIAVGHSADFLLVEAASVADAVAEPPLRRLTFKHGRKVAGRLKPS